MIAPGIRARLRKLALESCIDFGWYDRGLSLELDLVVIECGESER
jgi:hypothetical protein